MAKTQDFAEKARKATQEKGVKCPVCGTIKIPTLVVQSVRSAHGSYRFSRQRVQICKCNEKQYYA
jgi:formate dehydrogenase maturation protein FdhE